MKVREITEIVLMALARILKLNKNQFISQLDDRAEVLATFNYYPSCSRPDLVYGLKPHSDGSVINIVFPDKEVEGLHVLKDGEWVKVPIAPRALLVNLGNQIEVMSNGTSKSDVHRVVADSKERISVTMFYLLESEKMLEPVEGLVTEMRPFLFRKMKAKELLKIYYEKFAQG
ncbi:uncharacterized protein A4U43_C08F10420 [Asparagus officinalis]|nr:uncharacterized protein A4U43_C08F10420 [Asparagus officinalis]